MHDPPDLSASANKHNCEPAHRVCQLQPLRERYSLEDIVHQILSFNEYDHLDVDNFDLEPLAKVSPEPPITVASLSELDVSKIINRPPMRHDLNFEMELQFHPDQDNNKGGPKKIMSDAYWSALSVELALYMRCAMQPSAERLLQGHLSRNSVNRLPRLFTTLREILKDLIRDEDWPSIDQGLDVDLLMQQLRKGICDLISLSNWLGRVLRGSCSPLRDEMVDNNVRAIHDAVSKVQPFKLAEGLKNLFGFFELMKLVCLETPSKHTCSFCV